MSESLRNSEEEKTREEYLELTKKQTGSADWTPEDRTRLQELEKNFGINQPTLTEEQKDALHHQGTAGMRLGIKQELQPALTDKERRLIVEANTHSSRSSK